jgi:predicted acetyltransferase
VIDGLTTDIAGVDERPVLENMLQLYIHDFSELHANTPRCDLAADGRYHADIPLGAWWTSADHIPLLLRVDGKLAGFALLNAAAHSGAAVDRNMAEFFVVRKYRRAGIGTAAAHAIFSRYPGRWEAAVMRANTGARRFWEACITSHPMLTHIDIADHGDFAWDGAILRFEIAPA